MASMGKITVELHPTIGVINVAKARELAAEIVEGQPWNEEAKEIFELLDVVMHSLESRHG